MRAKQVSVAFGKVLRDQRTSSGLSQEALALESQVDRTFVSQMERGIRQPTLTTLCRLARTLNVAPSTLVARMERLLR
jgi:transcriptional regulator with XRE-family HTH domain